MRGAVLLAFGIFLYTTSFAQKALQTAAADAFMITRMVHKFHLLPKPIDDAFSIATFDRLIDRLDDERIYFTRPDMQTLLAFRLQLHDQVLGRKTEFLTSLAQLYEARLKAADALLQQMADQPFEFQSAETFTVAEDTSFAADATAQKNKIRKLIKTGVLDAITDVLLEREGLSAAQQKKLVDSLEAVFRKKTFTVLRRSIKKQLEGPGGIPQLVGEAYCEMIASYFDPHTNYFSLTTKENFESELGRQPLVFGFELEEDAAGHVVIASLKPGSPAFQSGQLNEGDRLMSIQWQGQSAIDVSDADVEEVAGILTVSNHDKARIMVKKADGTTRQVELLKARMDDDDDNQERVKGFLLKGPKTVGYISLPAFYSDWDNEENNINGCANDVAREIIKMKQEGMDALILDLRYNGGGSVREAVELAGIFIDAGPVAQIKDKGEKPFTLKDVNRGTIYNGPLFVMVNGFSASASELVAATLQDYNRAVIVGSQTYGKATGQSVLPMDTTINLQKDFSKRRTSSYIKMTMSKLYRVNGATAQFSGVVPDVSLPDIIEAIPQREANAPFAIPATAIEPNKYYTPLPAINRARLQTLAGSIVDTTSFFQLVREFVQQKQAAAARKDISLQWTQMLAAKQKASKEQDTPSFSRNTNRIFTVANHRLEEQRLKASSDLQEMNAAWKKMLEQDPYVQVTYLLATQFQ